MRDFHCVDCDNVFCSPAIDIDDAICPRCDSSDWVVVYGLYRDEAMEWDSYVLASAGWGTDEDYGYYGE